MNKRLNNLWILSMLLVVFPFGVNTWVLGSAYPPIEDAGINRSPSDRVWFHIDDDPLTLTSEGKDGDCSWGTTYYDYIDLANTQWSGSSDLSSTTGASVTWTPQAPNGAGVTITAVIDDDSSSGYGDDSSVSVSTPTLYAYRVGVDINRWWYSDNLYASPTTTASDNSFDTLWEDSATSTVSETDGLSHYLDADDDEEKLSRQKTIKMRWTLRTDPTSAQLGDKRIKVQPTANDNGGYVRGKVYDTDIFDGSSSVSVGISGGYGGWSAGVSTTITWGDDESDGYAAGGWSFSGDGFSDLNSTTQKYELASGDYDESELPKTVSASGSLSQTTSMVGLHGSEFESKYEVEGKANCIEGSILYSYGIAESSRTGTYSTPKPILITP